MNTKKEQPIDSEKLDDLVNYTTHIIDTHFHTFNWLDVKMQALLAIAAASLAIATFVVKDLESILAYEVFMIVFASVLLIIGMVISLIHLMPIMDSGVGNISNPRVAAGIVKSDKLEYFNSIKKLDKLKMLEYNCFQISGLARICVRGQQKLRNAVFAVGGGLILITITVSIWGVRTLDFDKKNKMDIHNTTQIETFNNKEREKKPLKLIQKKYLDSKIIDKKTIKQNKSDVTHKQEIE